MDDFIDYYEVLGVDHDASESQISNTYRRLALIYHPDHNPNNRNAIIKFKSITEAFETLGNSKKRAQYDTQRKSDTEVIMTEETSSMWCTQGRESKQQEDEDILTGTVDCDEWDKTVGERISDWLNCYQQNEWPLTHVLALPVVIAVLIGFSVYCWFTSTFLRSKYQ